MNQDKKLGIKATTKAASAIIGIAAGKATQTLGEVFTNVKRSLVSEATSLMKGFLCEESSRNRDLYMKPASDLVQELYCKNNNQGGRPTNNTFTDQDKKDLMNLLNVTKRENGTGFKAFTDNGFANIGKNASNAIKAATMTQGAVNLVADSAVDIYNAAKSTSKEGLRQANAALESDAILDTENLLLGLGSVYAGAFILNKFTSRLQKEKKNELDNIIANILYIRNKVIELEISKRDAVNINDQTYNDFIDNLFQNYYNSLLERAKISFEMPSEDGRAKTSKTVLFEEYFTTSRTGATQIVGIRYNKEKGIIVKLQGVDLDKLIISKLMSFNTKPSVQIRLDAIDEEKRILNDRKKTLVESLNRFIKNNSTSQKEEKGVNDEIEKEITELTIDTGVLPFYGGNKRKTKKSKRSKKSKTRKH